MRLNKQQNRLKTISSFLLLLFSIPHLYAQEIKTNKTYPLTDFRPPLDLPPSLAGSFGELRANHFHSGLDYRTNQREGYPVYAAADGYVSRLRVQIGGFGNAVYISHPNGYTTVYAHLQRFNERISQIIKDYQYRKQLYDVDFPLMMLEIPVKKGEVIAWSGNTGGSAGPHLHFEIRDSKTEETINPQLFGIDIPDKVKPVISGLYLYRLNGRAFSEKTTSQAIQLSGANGNYIAAQGKTVMISGETGFGIITIDRQLAGGNTNGVYSIEMLLDEQLIFSSALERFAFDNSRAINSHIDYPGKLRSGRTVQKSFIEPGNPLGIYKTAPGSGTIILKDQEVHKIKYIVKDIKGNTSTLSFNIKNSQETSADSRESKQGTNYFKYNGLNQFEAENLKVSIPKGVLYSDIDFIYSRTPRAAAFSSVHNVHTRLIPIHSGYDLWIKPERKLPEHLKSKTLIVNTQGANQGGSFDEKDGYVKASPRTFGSFYIAVDTIAPVIRPVNISDNKSMTGISRITLKISDNLSGIRSFTGSIDGQWVLMEFDSKTATLWHTFDSHTGPGKHLFQLTVTDMKMNSRTYTANFNN